MLRNHFTIRVGQKGSKNPLKMTVKSEILGVPQKNFPYLNCYFHKCVLFDKDFERNLSCNAQLRIEYCFISVFARIDFLGLFS